MIRSPAASALLYFQPPEAGDAVAVAVPVEAGDAAATIGLATTTGGGTMTTGTLICHAVGGPFVVAVDVVYEGDVQILMSRLAV